jgi:S1-C subfamily serine protease
MIRFVYEQLRKQGHVRRGAIGIVASEITPTLANGLGLGAHRNHPRRRGARLLRPPLGPAPGRHSCSPSMASRFKIREPSRYCSSRSRIGDIIAFKIQRGTEVLTLNVPVTERERDPESILDPTQSASNIIPKLGIVGIQITDSVAQLIPPTRSPGGILVTALTAGGNASLFGLQPGDVLHVPESHAARFVGNLAHGPGRVEARGSGGLQHRARRTNELHRV